MSVEQADFTESQRVATELEALATEIRRGDIGVKAIVVTLLRSEDQNGRPILAFSQGTKANRVGIIEIAKNYILNPPEE